jgi:hypothetical protein
MYANIHTVMYITHTLIHTDAATENFNFKAVDINTNRKPRKAKGVLGRSASVIDRESPIDTAFNKHFELNMQRPANDERWGRMTGGQRMCVCVCLSVPRACGIMLIMRLRV